MDKMKEQEIREIIEKQVTEDMEGVPMFVRCEREHLAHTLYEKFEEENDKLNDVIKSLNEFTFKMEETHKQALIDQIEEIKSRHIVPMNSTTEIILTRIEYKLKEKNNGSR